MLHRHQQNIAEFFNYAELRERIRINRENGLFPPWTNDPILQQYRFCNIFREDDKTTRWFRENIRDELNGSPNVLLATAAFRWFNRIEIGEILLAPEIGLVNNAGNWDSTAAYHLIMEHFPDGPWTTGSYIIMTPKGMNKLDGVLWCIDQFAKDAEHLGCRMEGEEASLEGVWEVLQTYPFLGQFMAYEVVTDLRHTYLLDEAEDINTWANPGPGAARGLSRIYFNNTHEFNRQRLVDRQEMMYRMQDLLRLSREKQYWPWPERPWEMREVEHTLCEFDKYQRAKSGQGRPRQKGRYLWQQLD